VRLIKHTSRWILVVVVTVGCVAAGYAEEVLGCPLGIDRGDIWLRTAYKHTKHQERYNPQTGHMEALPAGWSSKKVSTALRLGYGITDRWQVAVVTTRNEVTKHVRGRQGWVDVDASGYDGWWLALTYKSHESYEPWEGWQESHINWGIAYKFGCDGADAKNGIGNTADAIRVGLLTHVDPDDKTSLCQHLTYTHYGDADVVQGWPKSGWDFGDRVGYKCYLERDLSHTFAMNLGPIGWFQVEQDKGPEGQLAGYKPSMHNLHVGLEWHPDGVDIEHHKIILGVNYPYSAKTSFAPDYVLSGIAMWTW